MARLLQEAGLGIVQESENEEWVATPVLHASGTGRYLSWPRQPDGYACGLFALACVLLAWQGYVPCGQLIGIPGEAASSDQAIGLRHGAVALHTSLLVLTNDFTVSDFQEWWDMEPEDRDFIESTIRLLTHL